MAAKLSLSLSLILIILCAVAAIMCEGARSPPPSVDCSSLVLRMADCLSYVTNGSTTTKPEGTCCSGLKSVLKTSPECLCEAFKSSVEFGVVLNVTKALALPSACALSSSSATDYCGLSGAPAATPGGRVSPGSSPSPAVSGSETSSSSSSSSSAPINELSPSPSPSQGKSSASSTMLPISSASLFLSLLLLALFSSGF
ncbi:hypothetical protein PIB30_037081 [Stylosanthes scabra]|uniref:Bifunctional inhibitor/plant lipid transfer protein/seed storage helical domain-containing protein n=1 Tax=Stylosanthes scabra TaxID=79078 RepID=A0ABU6XDY0_9FABA|nr:hypothetical protein [Stylosanthes scabra]